MKFRRILLAAAAVCVAFGCNAQLLYKISGNGAVKPSYLFGTHHLAPVSVLDNTKGLRDALNSSDRVIGEIDMVHINQMEMAQKMQPYMLAPADSTLSKVISAEDFARIGETFKKYAPMPGMTLEMFEPMKPMVPMTVVVATIGAQCVDNFDPTKQLDTEVQKTAVAAGKEVLGLETVEKQAQVLYGTLPIRVQARQMVEGLSDVEKGKQKMRELTDSYMAADLTRMSNIDKDSDDPEEAVFMEELADKRNADWLKQLPALLKEKSNFIAVGALHLVGEKGLIEGLRKLGYKVEPVK